MPLPSPTYPPYVPSSFLSQGDQSTLTRAMELYAKYHPAAMQQRLYQSYLADEQFQAKSEQERAEKLMEQRNELLKNLSRFRSTGLGPMGSSGGGRSGYGASSGRSGASGGDLLDFSAAWGATTARKAVAVEQMGLDQVASIDRLYSLNGPFAGIVDQMLEEVTAPKEALRADTLAYSLRGFIGNRLAQLEKGTDIPLAQRRVAATEAYNKIKLAYPNFFELPDGTLTNEAVGIADSLDAAFGTSGFLTGSIAAGKEPWDTLLKEKSDVTAMVVHGGIPADHFERAARGVDLDLDLDGTVSVQEQAAAAREAEGIAAPLDPEEQAFLARYVDALRDDGVATREELGADYDQARAAYQKGALTRHVPRGTEPFYDEAYLRNLRELAGVDKQLAGIGARPPASALAAQRALNLPPIPREVMEATAAVSPLAAEALPYAMRRVQQSGGNVTPRTDPEHFAARLISSEGATRDFNAVAQAVAKRWPNDPNARREALAYYGAHYYTLDSRGTTLNQGTVAANPVEAATEAAVFMASVEPPPLPPERQMEDPRIRPPAEPVMMYPAPAVMPPPMPPAHPGFADPARAPSPQAYQQFAAPMGTYQPGLIPQAYADPRVQFQIEADRGLKPGSLDAFIAPLGGP